MEISFGSNANSNPEPSANEPPGESNSRLQKAIERNRQKQARRQARPSDAPQELQEPAVPRSQRPIRRSPPRETAREMASPPPGRPRTAATRQTRNTAPRSKATPRYNAKAAATVATPNWQASPKVQKLFKFIHKLGWIFCVLMLVRLIFTDRGAYEYYSRLRHSKSKIANYEKIKRENESLRNNIERIKSDLKYQKKLVREHLGLIDPDEFLILFPKEKDRRSK